MDAQLDKMNAILQNMQQALKCNICLDMLNKPLTTKCGHSFCGECVQQLVRRPRGSAQCPLCLGPITRRSVSHNVKVAGLVLAVRKVIASIKKDCCFEVTPSKYRPRPRPEAALADDDSENEEKDEPRRGTRKRGATALYNPEVVPPRPRPAKRRILAANGAQELSLHSEPATTTTTTTNNNNNNNNNNNSTAETTENPANEPDILDSIAREHSYSSPTKQAPLERPSGPPAPQGTRRGRIRGGGTTGQAYIGPRKTAEKMAEKCGDNLVSASQGEEMLPGEEVGQLGVPRGIPGRADGGQGALPSLGAEDKVVKWLDNSREVGFQIGLSHSSSSSGYPGPSPTTATTTTTTTTTTEPSTSNTTWKFFKTKNNNNNNKTTIITKNNKNNNNNAFVPPANNPKAPKNRGRGRGGAIAGAGRVRGRGRGTSRPRDPMETGPADSSTPVCPGKPPPPLGISSIHAPRESIIVYTHDDDDDLPDTCPDNTMDHFDQLVAETKENNPPRPAPFPAPVHAAPPDSQDKEGVLFVTPAQDIPQDTAHSPDKDKSVRGGRLGQVAQAGQDPGAPEILAGAEETNGEAVLREDISLLNLTQHNATATKTAMAPPVTAPVTAPIPPLAPPSSPPQTRKRQVRFTEGKAKRANTRYTALKHRLIGTGHSGTTAVSMKSAKTAKSPGWSHIEGARKELVPRNASLDITGGGEVVENRELKSQVMSSMESFVIEDTQFDVEHLPLSQNKRERVQRLKDIVSKMSVPECVMGDGGGGGVQSKDKVEKGVRNVGLVTATAGKLSEIKKKPATSQQKMEETCKNAVRGEHSKMACTTPSTNTTNTTTTSTSSEIKKKQRISQQKMEETLKNAAKIIEHTTRDTTTTTATANTTSTPSQTNKTRITSHQELAKSHTNTPKATQNTPKRPETTTTASTPSQTNKNRINSHQELENTTTNTPKHPETTTTASTPTSTRKTLRLSLQKLVPSVERKAQSAPYIVKDTDREAESLSPSPRYTANVQPVLRRRTEESAVNFTDFEREEGENTEGMIGDRKENVRMRKGEKDGDLDRENEEEKEEEGREIDTTEGGRERTSANLRAEIEEEKKKDEGRITGKEEKEGKKTKKKETENETKGEIERERENRQNANQTTATNTEPFTATTTATAKRKDRGTEPQQEQQTAPPGKRMRDGDTTAIDTTAHNTTRPQRKTFSFSTNTEDLDSLIVSTTAQQHSATANSTTATPGKDAVTSVVRSSASCDPVLMQKEKSRAVVPFRAVGPLCSERCLEAGGRAGGGAVGGGGGGGALRDLCLHAVPCEVYQVLMKYIGLLETQAGQHSVCCSKSVHHQHHHHHHQHSSPPPPATTAKASPPPSPPPASPQQREGVCAAAAAAALTLSSGGGGGVGVESEALFESECVVESSCVTQDMALALPLALPLAGATLGSGGAGDQGDGGPSQDQEELSEVFGPLGHTVAQRPTTQATQESVSLLEELGHLEQDSRVVVERGERRGSGAGRARERGGAGHRTAAASHTEVEKENVGGRVAVRAPSLRRKAPQAARPVLEDIFTQRGGQGELAPSQKASQHPTAKPVCRADTGRGRSQRGEAAQGSVGSGAEEGGERVAGARLSGRKRFRRIARPAASSSSSDSDDDAPPSASKTHTPTPALPRPHTPTQHLLDSEEMRDLERMDQNVWAEFGRPEDHPLDPPQDPLQDPPKDPPQDPLQDPPEDPHCASTTTTTTATLSASTRHLVERVERSLAKVEDFLGPATPSQPPATPPSPDVVQATDEEEEEEEEEEERGRKTTEEEEEEERGRKTTEEEEEETQSHGSSQSGPINTQFHNQMKVEIEALRRRKEEVMAALVKKQEEKSEGDMAGSQVESLASTCLFNMDDLEGEFGRELEGELGDLEGDQDLFPSNPGDLPCLSPPPPPPPPKRERTPRALVNRKRVAVFSGLCVSDKRHIQGNLQRLDKMGLSVRAVWGGEVTHVVVMTEDGVAPRTLKYLQGVVCGCWVVSQRWVLDSLQRGVLQDEARYEVVDETGGSGPSRSRTGHTYLLEGCQMCVVPPFEDMTLQQVQELAEMAGARVVASPKDFTEDAGTFSILLLDSEREEAGKEAMSVHGCVAVGHNWLVDSITSHQLAPLTEHLLAPPTTSVLERSRVPAALMGGEGGL